MQQPQLCGMVVLKVLTGIGLISDSFEGYSSYKCGCPSKQKTPPFLFLWAMLKKLGVIL